MQAQGGRETEKTRNDRLERDLAEMSSSLNLLSEREKEAVYHGDMGYNFATSAVRQKIFNLTHHLSNAHATIRQGEKESKRHAARTKALEREIALINTKAGKIISKYDP